MFKRFLLITILFGFVFSHPVIFKNGKVFWIAQNPSFNDIRFGISKTNKWLVGGRILEDRKSEQTFALINNNYLINRWNNKNSQTNFYLLSSVGLNVDNSKSMATIGLHGDWENRQFMVMEMLEYYTHNSALVSNSRLAYSPFKVDYTKTSYWFIAHYRIEIKNNKYSYTFFPVLRLYRNNYLLEFGNNGENTFLTIMMHF